MITTHNSGVEMDGMEWNGFEWNGMKGGQGWMEGMDDGRKGRRIMEWKEEWKLEGIIRKF